MLTLWDWENEKILLRTKAFSQDVYKVSFSPDNEGQLASSGTGHIKFWKMASTFTGLKLQGEIGKFGRSDLSDIVGFVHLPDGKVLSGTETGILLLWEGHFVKCEIWKTGRTPCHQGMVEVMFLEGNELLTAGHDGYLKFWDFEALDNSDISEEGGLFELEPLREIKIGDKVQIKAMLKGHDHWLLQDAGGALWKVAFSTFEITKVMDFHAGAISGLDVCPVDHVAATSGVDGVVRLVDYRTCCPLYFSLFPFPATTLLWSPLAVDPDGRTVLVGFEDGVIRLLLRCKDAFKVIHVSKPHSSRITCAQYSPDGKILATGSTDCTVFFLLALDNYSPLGFVRVEGKIRDISWSSAGNYLLVFCENGKVIELTLPASFMALNVVKDYEIKLSTKTYTLTTSREGLSAQEETPLPSIMCGSYSENGKSFLVAMDDNSGAILECRMDESTPIRQIKTHATTCCTFSYSHRQNFLLSGDDNGIIHIHSMADLDSVSPVMFHGSSSRIVRVVTSFDDSHLLSASEDGNFFIGRLTSQDVVVKSSLLPKAELEPRPLHPVDDITIATHYSIQEAKLRDEQDRLIKLAEEKKKQRRARVEALRSSFAALIEENKIAHTSEQFNRNEIAIDPNLRATIEDSVQTKLDLTRKELAWEREHKELLLQKLKQRYLDGIEAEKVTLRAFKSAHTLSSFTLFRSEGELKAKIESLYLLETKQDKRADEQYHKLSGPRTDRFGIQTPQGNSMRTEAISSGNTDEFGHATSAIDRIEEAKRKRLIRAKQWEEYYASMPSDKRSDDGEDVEKIRNALRNTGDYPLKMSKDYRVPENQRISAEKKKYQKLFLEASFYDIKEVFTLRDLKRKLVKSVDKYNQRIAVINNVLGVSEEPAGLSLDGREDPEKRFEFDKEALIAFEKQQISAVQSQGDNGLTDVVEKGRGKPTAAPYSVQSGTTGALHRAPSSKATEGSHETSSLEVSEKSIQHTRLRFEKELLQMKVAKLVSTFDTALNELRHEKTKIEADMKNAEMKLLVLSKELILLKEFEKQDTTLLAKLKAKKSEKAEFVAKITELHERLQARNGDLEQLADSVKVLEAEFVALVPESHLMSDPLSRIFERQVRRKARIENASSSNGYDGEELDDMDLDGDLDEDEEDETEDILPPGCDRGLFSAVLALRERRTAVDDARGDVRKAIDQIKKEIDSLAKKEKVVEASLKAAENEIQQFQTEKQQKLNGLDVVLTLQMSQIQCIVNNKLPEDLSDCLVFTNIGLAKLDERVHQLRDEITDLRGQLKGLRKEWSNLKKDKETKKILNKELDVKCVEVQMLKFGQVINLEALEQMSVNKTAEELKERLQLEERLSAKQLEVLESNFRAAKSKLVTATANNTERLQRLGDLTSALHFLETALDASKQGLVAEYDGRLKSDLQEENRLKMISTLQHNEISSRVNEIRLLRSKTGRVHM